MTSLHAFPGYANTPLAEWQEYPYQALQGGGRTRAVPFSTNKANPLHPSISFFFLTKGQRPKNRLGQRPKNRLGQRPKNRDKQIR